MHAAAPGPTLDQDHQAQQAQPQSQPLLLRRAVQLHPPRDRARHRRPPLPTPARLASPVLARLLGAPELRLPTTTATTARHQAAFHRGLQRVAGVVRHGPQHVLRRTGAGAQGLGGAPVPALPPPEQRPVRQRVHGGHRRGGQARERGAQTRQEAAQVSQQDLHRPGQEHGVVAAEQHFEGDAPSYF